MPSTEDFEVELDAQIDRASEQGRPRIEVNAGELHRTVGGYPPKSGATHRMPMCCGVMRSELARGNAEVIYEPESGQGASLTIRYYLPR